MRGEVLWTPPPDVGERSQVGQYMAWLEASRGLRFDAYQDLWQWSVDDLDAFWSSLAQWFAVRWHDEPSSAARRPQDARCPMVPRRDSQLRGARTRAFHGARR